MFLVNKTCLWNNLKWNKRLTNNVKESKSLRLRSETKENCSTNKILQCNIVALLPNTNPKTNTMLTKVKEKTGMESDVDSCTTVVTNYTRSM